MDRVLARSANLTRPHACSLSFFRIGEKDDSRTISMCGDAAAWFAVHFRPFVSPHCSIGNVCCIAIHCEALTTQQLQFACGTTYVPAEASVRRNHAMARNVDWYRIVVQRIADGPCGLRGSHRCSYRLVADHRAA